MISYDSIHQKTQSIFLLKDILGIMDWDTATTMPIGASEIRGQQLAQLKLTIQQIFKDPKFEEELHKVEENQDLNSWQKRNLQELKRIFIHQTAIDENLLKEFTELTSTTEILWREARKENNFNQIAPYFEKIFNLSRQIGEAKAEKLGCSVYEALVDEFDPGSNCQKIDVIFKDLEEYLPKLLPKILEKQKKQEKPIELKAPFPEEKQKKLALKLMEAFGFDMNKGRLDNSTHPFCGGATNDLRITTRYNEHDLFVSLFGVIHETGHALYEQGLPKNWQHQPVGKARSMSVHESQSLFYEKQIGRNPHFIVFLSSLLQEIFGQNEKEWESQNLLKHIYQVRPSFIRVEADEVTYPLHVILRYKLEKGLIEKQYKVKDLPDLWRQYMQKYLGITPPSDREGCLQDIHWPMGAIGYFPSYTIGALIAAQLFQKLRKEKPDVEKQFENGNFRDVLAWLRSNIHEHGSYYMQDDLLLKATDSPLSATPFKTHLEKRYLS